MELLRDIRLTGRHLIKQAGYSSAAVVVLALGIGATSGIFSAVHAILLRPLPIAAPDGLVVCWQADTSRDYGLIDSSVWTRPP